MKRLPFITILVVVIGAIATIVVNVKSCRNRAAMQAPSQPLSAAERTQARVRERMADPNYTNSLALLSDRQAQLVQLSHEAADEFKAWCAGYFASNEAARVLSETIYKLAGEGMTPTNADFAAKIAELESMIAADPQGKYLLDKRDKIAEALAEHERVAAAFVGERLRRQKAEHASEEAEAARRYREKMIAEGKVKPPAPRPAPATNMPPPRKDGWWTNQPPVAVGSSVPGSQFPVRGSGGTRSSASGGVPSQPPEPETRNLEPETK